MGAAAIKKIELHWDAAAAIVLVVVTSLGFNLYQRHQYRSMISESLDHQLAAQNSGIEASVLRTALEKCEGAAAR